SAHLPDERHASVAAVKLGRKWRFRMRKLKHPSTIRNRILAIQVKVKSWSRPVSRVLSWTIIHLGHASPHASGGQPGNGAGHTIVPLFGLAPGGVCHATTVTSRAVRSYRTISPLPARLRGRRRYVFCGTFRRLAPPRRYLAPCPAEPGLSSPQPI